MDNALMCFFMNKSFQYAVEFAIDLHISYCVQTFSSNSARQHLHAGPWKEFYSL